MELDKYFAYCFSSKSYSLEFGLIFKISYIWNVTIQNFLMKLYGVGRLTSIYYIYIPKLFNDTVCMHELNILILHCEWQKFSCNPKILQFIFFVELWEFQLRLFGKIWKQKWPFLALILGRSILLPLKIEMLGSRWTFKTF